MGRLRRQHGLRQRRGARSAARPGAAGLATGTRCSTSASSSAARTSCPYGEFDWSGHLDAYTPDIPVSDDPNAWHPDDALFAPMRAADGTLLGILSVDEPISGRKPSGDEIDVLVAVSEHAALAVQAAQEATRAKANREALEHLLAVSAPPQRVARTRTSSCSTCAQAISEALGFEKVAVQLLNRERRHATRRSPTSGFGRGREHRCSRCSAEQVERLLASRARRGVPAARRRRSAPKLAARSARRLPARSSTAAARTPGRTTGSSCPLFDRRGRRIGYIWADDPHRPAAPRARAPAHPARVREPGDDRARAGRTVRGDPERARAPARADRRVAGRDRRLRLRRARALVERRRDGDVRLDARKR